MKVMAAQGQGFVPIPTVVLRDAAEHHQLHPIGVAERCKEQFYAITAERKITHPVVSLLTENAQQLIFA